MTTRIKIYVDTRGQAYSEEAWDMEQELDHRIKHNLSHIPITKDKNSWIIICNENIDSPETTKNMIETSEWFRNLNRDFEEYNIRLAIVEL